MKKELRYKHCVVNTNPWFSAVTEYSLQFIFFLSLKHECVVVALEKAPLWKHLTLRNIKKVEVKERFKKFNLLMCLFFNVLFSHRECVFWCFEGREHTFLGILRILWGPFWGQRKIVRVRGQAQKIRSSGTHRFLYGFLTHYTAFASWVLYPENRLNLKKEKYGIHYFVADKKMKEGSLESHFIFGDSFSIESTQPLVSVVGRYDPVKGHEPLLDVLLNFSWQEPLQCVFFGQSQNIKMSSLVNIGLQKGGKILFQNEKRVLLEKGNLRVFFFDERISSLDWFFQKTWIGIISSLGSEVICRVALEFMQNGTRVLSTDVGALREVVGSFEENKVLSVNDFSSFPLLIESMLGEHFSPEELSLKSCEKFGLAQFESLYQKGISS